MGLLLLDPLTVGIGMLFQPSLSASPFDYWLLVPLMYSTDRSRPKNPFGFNCVTEDPLVFMCE